MSKVKVKKHSRTLTDPITERAKKSFQFAESMEYYEIWCDHWVETAKKFHAELIAEGLVMTAEKVQEIINFNVKFDVVIKAKRLHNG